jgi:hypothetical protein
MWGRAEFDFPGDSAQGQLKLQKGDIVQILVKGNAGAWCRGKTRDGHEGFFPTDFVSVHEQMPTAAAGINCE